MNSLLINESGGIRLFHQLDPLKDGWCFRVRKLDSLFRLLVGKGDGEGRYFRPFESFVVFVFEVGRGENDGGGSVAGDAATVVEVAEISAGS